MSASAIPRRQQGVALLIFAVILVLGVSAFLVNSLNSATLDEPTRTRNRNAEALQEAKRALIGYVVKEVLDLAENNVPGRLPCPETAGSPATSNEGQAAASCEPTFPSAKTIGRLPWRTLGVDRLVDAANEPLWYVVSPNWVNSGSSPTLTPPMINSGTAGQLTVDGTSGVVAVIIAPGRPLSIVPNANQIAAGCQARQQLRNDRAHVASSTTNLDYRDYLECQNGSNPIDTTLGTSIPDDPGGTVLNDQIIYVTASDILNAIQGPLAERMQRTVAPLLREYSSLWPGNNFLPYAASFKTPEDSSVDVSKLCGPASPATQHTEGLLPIAPNSGTDCVSTWDNASYNVSGPISLINCTPQPSTNIRCSFRYYKLTLLGISLFGGSGSADVTIQATAPHAAASFRTPLVASDIILPAGSAVQSIALNPQTDGNARMSLVVRITNTDMCVNNPLLGLVCNILDILLATPITTTVEFPQLPASTNLQGTKLSSVVRGPGPTYSFDLLAPAATDPHYWFMQNQWYRYTYYAISPNSSAAAAPDNLTVSGFPAANGNDNDKRFVLTVMGPAVAGQTRSATATLNQYVEGANAASSASPRVFAYQVYSASGNDRIVTCPFNDGGASQCD